MRTIAMLLSVLFLSAGVYADNERLVHLRTTLPVQADHISHVVIADGLNLVVLDTTIVGSLVDIFFRFVASDFDGTLSPLAPEPSLAKPNREALAALHAS